MEPKISPQEFREHYDDLPSELQEMILSELTADKIERIVVRNNATRHMSEIARLTGRVLLGVLPPDRFISALADHLQIDKQAAADMAQDINREIFFPIRESLKELYGLTTVETEPSSITPSINQAGETSGGKTAAPPREPARQPPMTFQGPKPYSTPVVGGGAAALPPSDLPVSSSEIESQQAEVKTPEKPEAVQSSDDKSSSNKVSADKYKETVEPEDTQNLPPQTPKPQPGPKIEGNVIDLKGIDVE